MRKIVFWGIVLSLMLVNSVWAATPPQPTYGVATVDGNPTNPPMGEWVADDFFANMHLSANPKKDVLSKLYLRYDCQKGILYGLVLAEVGHTIDVDAGQPGEEHFIKINGVKIVSDAQPPDGVPPDFQWIKLSGNTALGWEASASLAPGEYTINVHTQVDDGQTSAVENRAIKLVIHCPTDSIILTSFTAKSGNAVKGPRPGPEGLELGLGGLLVLVALCLCVSMARRH